MLGDNLNHNVLLVDDEEDLLEILEFFLLSIPYQLRIEKAENGEAALEAMKNTNFDLVISDYNMPAMNGLSLLQELRGIGSKACFVLISGNLDKKLSAKAEALGAFALLDKPIKEKDFYELVQQALSLHKAICY